jgi:hypothetical protein
VDRSFNQKIVTVAFGSGAQVHFLGMQTFDEQPVPAGATSLLSDRRSRLQSRTSASISSTLRPVVREASAWLIG